MQIRIFTLKWIRIPPTNMYLLDFFNGTQQKLTLLTSGTSRIGKNTKVAPQSKVCSEDSGLQLGRNVGSSNYQTLFQAPSKWVTSRCHHPLSHPLLIQIPEREILNCLHLGHICHLAKRGLDWQIHQCCESSKLCWSTVTRRRSCHQKDRKSIYNKIGSYS